ncbi:ATP-dependent DNA ligase [Leifsonia sp. Leaf264]|uniref:ATP-dependent DNA ligase n=1 Tax=Leifsonia sp. Leaf264 TaxID=1736314 RepID=UPI001F2DBBFE|nr:ATP-dependent DNA ligase [Leifsonia sp. Leaf264]
MVVPVDVALARPVAKVPHSGDLQFEPKLDGFRTVIVRDGTSTTLWSRARKPLTDYFPEVVAAASKMIPDGCVVDGETVIWAGSRLDFDAMQRRMGRGAKSAAKLAHELPASFAAFDLLAVAGHDIRPQPLRLRRQLLDELGKGWAPPLTVNMRTLDPNVAEEWMWTMPNAGIEGVVVKELSARYIGGTRAWGKVKHRNTIDTVAGAVIGSFDRPYEIVVGFWRGSGLRIAGRSTPLAPAQARTLAPLLLPPLSAHDWPAVVKPGALSHFSSSRDEVHLSLIEPLVVEVSADIAWSGESFRHGVRFLRARPDVDPRGVVTPGR